MQEPKGKDYLSEIFSPIRKELSEWKENYIHLLKRKEKLFYPIFQYLVSLPQREIRPALIFLSARAVSCDELNPKVFSQLKKFAVLTEVFHTALLLQNSVVQNIQINPGEQEIKNQSYVLLFSDYLLAKSFSILQEIDSLEIGKKFADIFNSISESRIRETNFLNDFNLAEEDYIKMIENKTAKLMSTACGVGVEIVKGKDLEREALEKFGLNFGLALQIVDDCLNVMDKNSNFIQDLDIKKYDFPLFYLFYFLPLEEKKEIFSFLGDEKGKLPRARSLSLVYRAIELALKKAKYFSDQAKKNIDILPKSRFKESLIALADFPLERLSW